VNVASEAHVCCENLLATPNYFTKERLWNISTLSHSYVVLRGALQVTMKKLKRYEKDYFVMKEKLALEEDPVVRIEVGFCS